ncbi:NAD-dependent epimerase/dehydratase family protein [Nocardioides sp.]|uniref:NAD-dependent epimerase/dehydratase family protein n=1 Tax=Nocardioides sp. TaxID=35761 RepID=UPI003561DC35
MKLLVLGGTVFLSKAVAEEAVRRGHEVTCACRGESGTAPAGARHLTWDRDQAPPGQIASEQYDAVVDVARHPSRVRSAVAALPEAHWIFVSTINVYEDSETTGGGPGRTPLREPITDDVDLSGDMEAYGPMKVACEQIVQAGAATSMVIRPGLIVGPGDPSGRFTYWPVRLAEGGEVLAPGSPHDLNQIIDVRDLAAWIVDSAEQKRSGVFDGIGPATPIGDLLAACAEGVDADVTWTWVDQEFLAESGVAPWMGPDSIPLWLPRPEHDGTESHDAQPSMDAGMPYRSPTETTRDTLAWVRATPDAKVSGIDRTREREILDAWHAREV